MLSELLSRYNPDFISHILGTLLPVSAVSIVLFAPFLESELTYTLEFEMTSSKKCCTYN